MPLVRVMVPKIFLSVLIISTLKNANTQAQQLVSPCPRLFTYEATKSNEAGTWYATLTLLSDTDLNGIWLRLILDRPSLQLGNWFGEVTTTDNKEFLIKNRNYALKAHVPRSLRFYIKYNPSEPIPQVISYRVNAKTICPESAPVQTTTPELQTSGSDVQQPTPNPVRPPVSGGDATSAATTDGDDYYPGDFYNLFNRPVDQADQDNSFECGKVVVRPNPSTANDQSTIEGQFPWHATIYFVKGINLEYVCTASLISKLHVISVAHCITRSKSKVALTPDKVIVYLGKYFLRGFTNRSVQDRQAAVITPHPDYNPQTYSNDVGIVRLAAAVDLTDYVRPICLWQDSADLNSLMNQQGNVVGFGYDQTGKLTDRLMKAKMSIITPEKCAASFNNYNTRFSPSKTYCAGYRNGTTVCNGDSGGAMIFQRSQSDSRSQTWQLRGLVTVSEALQGAVKCDTSRYVVFTDTVAYLDWIKEAIKN